MTEDKIAKNILLDATCYNCIHRHVNRPLSGEKLYCFIPEENTELPDVKTCERFKRLDGE